MAQRIRHLTTNQGIAGSSPARVKLLFFICYILLGMPCCNECHSVDKSTWYLIYLKGAKNISPLGGLEPPTFRLTAERASQLRHRGKVEKGFQRLASPWTIRLQLSNCRDTGNHSWSHWTVLRYGLVVRIPGSHPGGPGSIPGNGNTFSRDNF